MFGLYNERNRTYFLERKGRVHMKKRENEMQYRTQIEGDKEIIRNILDFNEIVVKEVILQNNKNYLTIISEL